MNTDSHCSYIAELINFMIDKSGENQRVSVSTLMNQFEKKRGSFNESRELVEHRISEAVKSLLKRCPDIIRRAIWMTGYNTETGKFEYSSSARALGEGTSRSQEIPSRPGQAPPTQSKSKLEAINTSNPVKIQQNGSCSNGVGPSTSAAIPAVPQSFGAPKLGLRLPRRPVEEDTEARTTTGSSGTVVAEHQRFSAAENRTPTVFSISPNLTRRNQTVKVPASMSNPSLYNYQQIGNSRNGSLPSTLAAVPAVPQSFRAPEFRLSRQPVGEDTEVRCTTGSSTPPALRTEQKVQNGNCKGLPSTSASVPPVPQSPGAPELVLRLSRRPVEEDTGARTTATVNRTPNVMISPNPTIRTGTSSVPASMSSPSPSHNRQNGNSLNRGLPGVPVASQSSESPEIGSTLPRRPVNAVSTAKKPAESSTPASRTEQRTVNGSPLIPTFPNPTGRNETAPGAAEPAVNKKRGLNLEASSPQEEKRIRAWRPSGYQLSPAVVNGTPNLARRNRRLPVRSQPNGSSQNGRGAPGTSSKSSEPTASTSKSNGVNEAPRSVEPVVYNFGNYQQQWDGKEKPKPSISRQEAIKSSPTLSNEESRTVSKASPLTIDSEHQNGGGASGTSSKSSEPTTSSSSHASTSKSNGVNEAPRSVEPVVYHFGNYQQQFDEEQRPKANASEASPLIIDSGDIAPALNPGHSSNPDPVLHSPPSNAGPELNDNIEISSARNPNSSLEQEGSADAVTGSEAQTIPSSFRKRQNADSPPAFVVPKLPIKVPNPLKRPAEEKCGDRNSSLPSRGAGKRKVIKPREFTPYEDRKGKYETGERSMEGMLDKLREPSVSISRGSSPDSQAPVEPVSGPPPAKRGRGRPPKNQRPPIVTAPIPPAPQEEPREPSEDSTQPSSSVTPATAEDVIAVTDLALEKVRTANSAEEVRKIGDKRRGRKPKIAPAPPVEVEDPKNEDPSPTLAVLKLSEPSTSTSRVLSSDSQFPVGPAAPMCPALQEEPREPSEDICMPYSRTVTLTTADNLFPQNLTMYGNLSRVVVAATDGELGKTPADKRRGRQPKIAQVDVSPRNPVLAENPRNRPSTSTAESIVSHQGANPILPIKDSRPSPLLIDSDDIAPTLNPGHSSNPEPVLEPELPRLSPSQNDNNSTGISDSSDKQEQPAGDEQGSETQSIPGPSSPPTFAVPTVPPNRSKSLKRPAEENSEDTKSPKLTEPSASTSHGLEPISRSPAGKKGTVRPPPIIVAPPIFPAPQEEHRESSQDSSMPLSISVTPATARSRALEKARAARAAKKDGKIGDKKRGRKPKDDPAPPVDAAPGNPTLVVDPRNRPSNSKAEQTVSHQGAKKPSPILPNEKSRPSPLLIDSDDIAPTLNPAHSSNPEPVPEPELPRTSSPSIETSPVGSSDSILEQVESPVEVPGSEAQNIPSSSRKRKNEDPSPTVALPKLPEPSTSTSHGLSPDSQFPAATDGTLGKTPADKRRGRQSNIAQVDVSPRNPPLVEDSLNRLSTSTAEPIVSHQGAKKSSPDSDDTAPALNSGHSSNPEPAPEPELPRTSSPSIETSTAGSSDSILEQEESAVEVPGSEAQTIPRSSRKRQNADSSPTLAVPKLPKLSTSTSHGLSPDSQLPVGPAASLSPAPQEGPRELSEDRCMPCSRSVTLTTVDSLLHHNHTKYENLSRVVVAATDQRRGRQPKIAQVDVAPRNPVLADDPLDRPSTSSSHEPILRIDRHREERDVTLSEIYKIFGEEEQESSNNETAHHPAKNATKAKIETSKAAKAAKISRRTSAPKDVSEDLVTFLQKMTQIVIQPIAVEVLAGLYWVQTPNVEVEGIQRAIEKILNSMFNLDIDASTKALILYMTQAPVPKRLLAQIRKEVEITLHLDHERKIFQCQTKSISLTRNVNVELEEWDPTEMEEMMSFILTVAQANQQLTLNDICKMYQESIMNGKGRAAEDVRIKVISCVTCTTPTTYNFINIAAGLMINFKIPLMDEVKEVILSGGEFQLDDKGYLRFYKMGQYVAGQVNDMMTNPVIKKNLENLKGLMKAFHDGMETENLEFLKDLMEEVNVRMEKLVGAETIKIMEVRQSLSDAVRIVKREASEESTDDNSICVAKVLRILLATANVLTGSLAKEVQVTVQKVVKDYEVHPEKIPQEKVLVALRAVMNLRNE